MGLKGTYLESAHTRLALVVAEGTKDYAIVITLNPEPQFPLYGVRNKTTGVDEYITPSLAKALFVVVELQKDLDEGYDRLVGPPPGGSAPMSGMGQSSTRVS